MGFFDDTLGLGKVEEWVEDGFDYLEQFGSDLLSNPFDALGKFAEDSLKTIFGVNLYKSFIPDVPTNNPVYEDRKVTTRSALASQEIVYGKVKKGGSVVYLEASGENDEFLHMVIILASHSCNSIEEVYFGDTLVATKLASGSDDSQTFTIEEDYTEKLVLHAQLGAHTSALAAITSDSPDNWTSNHILKGHTFLYVKLSYDRELYRRGVPQITVLMKGKDDIYDPRTDTSGYSNNHALCCLDYLMNENGVGIPSTDIYMQSFEDAADHADDSLLTVTGGSNEPRYVVSGVISIDRRPLDHLEELQKAGAAYITRSQGVWKYIRAEYQSPALSLDESDLAAGLNFTPSASKQGRLNTVKGVYVSEENNFEATDYPSVAYSSYISQDQEELSGTIDYNFVSSPYQAQRLGKIAIERSRYGMMVSGVFKLNAIKLDIGSRVFLNISYLGINDAVFVVLEMDLSLSGGISLTLRQDDASIYTDTPEDRVALTASPVINLPSPNPIMPTGLNITEELYSTNGGIDVKARAVISWTEPAGRVQAYDVQFKDSAGSDWRVIETASFGDKAARDDLAEGTYDFRVRGVNNLSWVSDWAYYEDYIFLGKTAPPPNVTSLAFNNDALEWSYPDEPIDLAGFEVRYSADSSATWETASSLHAGLVSYSKYYLGFTPTSEALFFVKARDSSGIYSTQAVVTTLGGTPGNPLNYATIVSETITEGSEEYTGYFGAGAPAHFPGGVLADAPDGTSDNTTIFGATLNAVFSKGSDVSKLFCSISGITNPAKIESLEFRYEDTDPWQTLGIAQDNVISSNQFNLEWFVSSLFHSRFSPADKGGIKLRFAEGSAKFTGTIHTTSLNTDDYAYHYLYPDSTITSSGEITINGTVYEIQVVRVRGLQEKFTFAVGNGAQPISQKDIRHVIISGFGEFTIGKNAFFSSSNVFGFSGNGGYWELDISGRGLTLADDTNYTIEVW